MSLIEKALEKMQESRSSAPQLGTGALRISPGAQKGPFGKVVNVARGADAGRAPAIPTRTVEINERALRDAGLLPPDHQVRQIGRQYRQIKRPLIANAFGLGTPQLPDGRLLMVTSAMPGEGKTFTAINLAFSLALEKDLHTLLVDADCLKPHISRLLGVDKEPGLLDFLQGARNDIESLILPTSIPGLSVLPAGNTAENMTELFASDRMRELVMTLCADPQRLVLFDSPPLLLTTESQVLVKVVGQTVVVVRAETSPQRSVAEALELVGEGRYVALILNQNVTAAADEYYHYYGNNREGGDGRSD